MNEVITKEAQAVAVQEQPQNMATMFMSMASNPDCDVEKLERLMALFERDNERKAQVEFNQAFAEMQSEIGTVTKSKQGHNYKYATLEDIVDIVRPVLQSFGFAVSFSVDTSSKVSVTCTLMHKGGHSISTTMLLDVDKSGSKNAVQALGSSVSYGKRYTLSSLLNIATRDDDDAQSAMQRDNRIITSAQSAALETKFDKLPESRQVEFNKWLNDDLRAASIAEIRACNYNMVLAALNKAIA